MSKAPEKINIYQIVTDRIIASLKQGIIPWERPWKSPSVSGGGFPRNFRTGKPYRGVNVFLLWSSPFSSPFWLTYKQASELKGTVRKGEKGTQIVFYKQLRNRKSDEPSIPEPETNGKKERTPFVLTYYTVFNVEQCDGLQLPSIEDASATPMVEADEACDTIVSRWAAGPTLNLSGAFETRACYRPGTDVIHMPLRSRFVDAPHYYSTLFHELIHSTGHQTRLNRSCGDRFGDELYSKEELVAETGAAFLCVIAGISNERTDRNTTAYIQNWIEKLNSDNRLIVHAAASAQRAADLITGHTFTEEESEEQGGAGTTGTPYPVTDYQYPLAA